MLIERSANCTIIHNRETFITAKHIPNYYSHEMNVNKASANTVKHRHANINKGDPAEFGVIAASFYGLRRSEVLGLRWDAIDFESKTITIKHTVNEARVDGKCTLVMADTTKTKSSFRTLPLVDPFEEMLLKMKMEQEENKWLCGNCYCQDYIGYIYVNEIGEIIKPGFLTSHFASVLKANNMPRIRFHDLRHPYVKHTTKKYTAKQPSNSEICLTALEFCFC